MGQGPRHGQTTERIVVDHREYVCQREATMTAQLVMRGTNTITPTPQGTAFASNLGA